jgi:peptidyl-prolyl cis-trans isomerase A (cyclophilin A)
LTPTAVCPIVLPERYVSFCYYGLGVGWWIFTLGVLSVTRKCTKTNYGSQSSMRRKKLDKISGAFTAVFVIGMIAASLFFLGAARAGASPADKRKSGLYWTFETDKGKIACKLYETEAPVTVHTMVGLAIGKISYVHPETKLTERKKFFDGLIFDRVIPGVMIQGGDLLGTGVGHPEGPGFPYKTEIAPSLKFDAPGRLAMANGSPDTNDTHFFIAEAAYPSFDGKYTIWGTCENVDVVKAIAHVPRDIVDTPVTPLHIQHVIVERVGAAPADAAEAMPPDAAAH